MSASQRIDLRVIAGGLLDQQPARDGYESTREHEPAVCGDCAAPARRLSFTAVPLCDGCRENRDLLAPMFAAICKLANPEQIEVYVQRGFPADVQQLVADPLHLEEFRDLADLVCDTWRAGVAARAA